MGYPLLQRCLCGTLLWDTRKRGFPPRYEEAILCPSCGWDGSLSPPFRYRWGWAKYQWRKRRRSYGLLATLRWWLRNPKEIFLLPRERRAYAQEREAERLADQREAQLSASRGES